MSAKNVLTVELNCLIISGKQGMQLLIRMTRHHRLERVRKVRDDTVELALQRTCQQLSLELVDIQLYNDLQSIPSTVRHPLVGTLFVKTLKAYKAINHYPEASRN